MVMKCVRGFTLNHRNSEVINYGSVRELLLSQSKESITLPTVDKIRRDPLTQTVYNRPEAKTYRLVYTKRRVVSDMNTVPFGYVDVL